MPSTPQEQVEGPTARKAQPARGVRAALLALSVALAIGGCGSSSSKPQSSGAASTPAGTSSTAALSESAFLTQGNAACHAVNAEVSALKKPNTLADLVTYSQHVLPIAEAAKAKLAALVPPAAKQAAYARYLSEVEQVISRDREVEAAARANNLKAAETVGHANVATKAESHALAKELGLEECAKEGESSGGESTTTTETPTSTGETP